MSRLTCAKCGNADDASEAMCSKCGTPYPVPEGAGQQSIIRKGQVIANRYVVMEMIGRGGMGAIYKVHDNTLGEVLALKTLLPEYVKEKMVVERFFNEARIARKLSHPNIVRTHDIGVTDGMVYISMELLAGRTLRSMMDKVTPGRRIPLNAILRMFDALCAALDYAHQYTIHRDIKPENVMVLPDGTIKLMDFGISKLMSNPNLTSASMVMGTPHYMSPEQLKNSANVDARADIYSVGVMLYEILTGDIPTGFGRKADTIQEVPRALDPIIASCCHPDPNKRFKNVAELRDKLRAIRVQVETNPGAKDGAIRGTDLPPKARTSHVRKVIAVIGVAMITVSAYFAMNVAKERQQDIIANAGSEPSAVPSRPISVQVAPDPDTFADMKPIVARAARLAGAALLTMEDAKYYEHAVRLVDEADAQWLRATGSTSDRDGLDAGWPVLHRYLAVCAWPDGVAFIPEGSVNIPVNGADRQASTQAFFIDLREVSAFDYETFCQDEGWRSADSILRGSRDSATNVTYYDALGYLGHAEPARKLPTPAQWLLAADTAKRIEPDNVYLSSSWNAPVSEWLRSEVDLVAPEQQFGVDMPIVTWNARGSISVDAMPFEGFDKNVGFRGVIEFPTTLAKARAWLK